MSAKTDQIRSLNNKKWKKDKEKDRNGWKTRFSPLSVPRKQKPFLAPKLSRGRAPLSTDIGLILTLPMHVAIVICTF